MGEFIVGDLAIYFSIDSIPDFSDPNTVIVQKRGRRIKTIKLRGVISQGLLAPLSWLESRGHSIDNICEGLDVTELMGVTKYICEEEQYQYGFTLGARTKGRNFPTGVPRTDESKLQSHPHLLEYIQDRNIVITRKEDGCSATFVYQDEVFQVCGRNCCWSEPTKETNHYFVISLKEKLEDKMRRLNVNLAIQGEIVGPKINGNRMKLQELRFEVFRIWNIDENRFLWWRELVDICQQLQLDHVPVVFFGHSSSLDLSVPGFLRLAENQRYGSGALAEGIVVRADEGRPVSFKVISNSYLLKHGI